jgi:hypothetical protein
MAPMSRERLYALAACLTTSIVANSFSVSTPLRIVSVITVTSDQHR